MLSENGTFVKLPQERILFKSPSRTSFTIATPSAFPGGKPYSLGSSDGVVSLTNQRIVYLPTLPLPANSTFQSFSCPISNLHDTHVVAPFFGANYWTAVVQPVTGGGFPDSISSTIQLKLTFKEGGAFDFHSGFEKIRERLVQALEVAQMNNDGSAMLNYGNVHTDELPAYDAPMTSNRNRAPLEVPTSDLIGVPSSPPIVRSDDTTELAVSPPPPPSDLPPGYYEIHR